MMLRETSLRLAGAAALLLAAAAPAQAMAGDPPQQTQASSAPSDRASDTTAAPTEAAKPKPKPAERRICRMVNGSESRLGAQRVCLTEEQWKHAYD